MTDLQRRFGRPLRLAIIGGGPASWIGRMHSTAAELDGAWRVVAGVVSSGLVLAAVRSATPPFPSDEAGAAPFTAGRWLFSHNGAVAEFARASVELRSRLPAAAAPGIEGRGLTGSRL